MSYDKVYVSAWVTANRKFMLLYEILKKSCTDNQLISVIHFVLSLGQYNFSLSFLNAYKHSISFFRFPRSLSRLLRNVPG